MTTPELTSLISTASEAQKESALRELIHTVIALREAEARHADNLRSHTTGGMFSHQDVSVRLCDYETRAQNLSEALLAVGEHLKARTPL